MWFGNRGPVWQGRAEPSVISVGLSSLPFGIWQATSVTSRYHEGRSGRNLSRAGSDGMGDGEMTGGVLLGLTGPSSRTFGVLLIALGLPQIALSVHMLRNANWRQEGWWGEHPRLVSLMSTKGSRVFSAILGLILAALMTLLGLFLIVHG